MKTPTRAGRALAAGGLVLGVLSVSACDLTVGPPVQDLGYEHSVGSGYCGQVSRNGRSPKCSAHSPRVRSRPTARQANSTALSLDRSQS
jgi:hypothetical protein